MNPTGPQQGPRRTCAGAKAGFGRETNGTGHSTRPTNKHGAPEVSLVGRARSRGKMRGKVRMADELGTRSDQALEDFCDAESVKP